ncbi:ABC transporter substrate-binding protein [Pontivivens insulae]|uniref:Probable sugar-binding periplasmic protein n=1 Tax=Pontivivens insulae TaxID=1639689 RepID=A0A2R8AE60_9RHOB|nr:ABC transporter substrate-binding protein [Pontivivens insulae]RED14428.1 carbohydrate ABC transporter substrate-binding protein (CUT1 family) [Pontivivens insulae]SPF30506.1 putative sugar-binding periplasmic protein [Pontivivens insulae]
MPRLVKASAITFLLTSTAAVAESRVEVMHFWTSGGEAAALGVIRDRVLEEGVAWDDAPVAGGGGDQAKTVLQARVASGNPPAAMLMLGQNIIDWANEGILGDVNAVAERESWDEVLPQAVQDFNKVNGNYVAAPTNVHRTDMIWASTAAFDAIGADYPTTWEEFNALAPRFVEAGIVPVAHGGQAWQEAYMFEALVLGVGGSDFYRDALVDLNPDALQSDTMQAVFAQMGNIRGMVDEDFSGRDWNLATAMVINGDAAMQIMGDWAKGEFTNAGQTPGEDFVCIPVPTAVDEGFVYLVNSLSFFAQPDADAANAQAVLASAIMDPEVQVAFNQAKGAIPARTDVDMSALDACAQETAADFAATDAAGTAVPTFAGTHAAQASVVGAATDVITEFFNTDMTPDEAATLLAEAIELAQ